MARSPAAKSLIAALSLLLLHGEALAVPVRSHPAVQGVVTNFYYDDLAAARRWYIDEMGLKPVYDDGWVVIVELAPGMQVALVDGAKGVLKPVKDKGTMLSIETSDIDAWYRRALKARNTRWFRSTGATPAPTGIAELKDIYEFRLVDPGGYIVEFYKWRPGYPLRTMRGAAGDPANR